MGEVKDVEEVKQKIKQQKKLEKQTIKEVTRYLSGENVSLTEWQNPQELIEIKAETQKLISTAKYIPPDNDNHQTFEHKYQRYEWLLKQKDLSEEDKIWIKIMKIPANMRRFTHEEKICQNEKCQKFHLFDE